MSYMFDKTMQLNKKMIIKMTPSFIPPHGNYKELRSYKKALIVYDATMVFAIGL